MADSKTFLFPPEEAQAVAQKIEAAGGPSIDPTQPTGKATTHGVTLAWAIADGKITVTLVSKPWVVPESQVWVQLTKLFLEAS